MDVSDGRLSGSRAKFIARENSAESIGASINPRYTTVPSNESRLCWRMWGMRITNTSKRGWSGPLKSAAAQLEAVRPIGAPNMTEDQMMITDTVPSTAQILGIAPQFLVKTISILQLRITATRLDSTWTSATSRSTRL